MRTLKRTIWRKRRRPTANAVELDPSELSHQRGLGQTLVAEEKYPEALKVSKSFRMSCPTIRTCICESLRFTASSTSSIKQNRISWKARQYAPGSLEVMYKRGHALPARRALRRRHPAFWSDAVTGIKGQSPALSTRRRSLAILYQQLGQLYRDTQNYPASIYSFEELGHLGEEEDRRARMMIMDTYGPQKTCLRRCKPARKRWRNIRPTPRFRTSHALLLGENGQTEDAVKILRAQLHGDTGDRETYLNIAQVYERGRRYKEAEEAARAAEVLPGSAARKRNGVVLARLPSTSAKSFSTKPRSSSRKVLAGNPKNAPVLNYYGLICWADPPGYGSMNGKHWCKRR